MPPPRRVRVFLNNRSGIGGVTRNQLCTMFEAHGVPCEVTVLRHGCNLTELGAKDHADVVWIAAGGDGTINTLARALAGTGRTMAVLPCGTLNHFAQDLGIPLKLPEAVAVAAKCPARFVDAAEVNGIVFVNNSGLGVYPAMVLDRERMKRSGGNKWIALAIASSRAFLRFRSLHVTLEIDGERHQYKTPLLFVGNNDYEIEGGRLGRRARLDAGKLSLYLVPAATRVSMLRLLGGALIGRVRGAGMLIEFSVERFTVTTRPRRLRVAFDGEVRRMPPPLHYRILPAALRVVAPPAGVP